MAVDTNPNSPTYGMDLSTGQYVPTNAEGAFYQGPMEQYVPPPVPAYDPGPYNNPAVAQVDTNPISPTYGTYMSGPYAGAPAPADAQGGSYGAPSTVFANGQTYSPNAYANEQVAPPTPFITPPRFEGAGGMLEGSGRPNQITPPSVGSGGLATQFGGAGPNGRTFDEITGTDYLSQEERRWYLNQLGKDLDAQGNVIPLQSQITPPSGVQTLPTPSASGGVGPNGRTVDQIRGTDYLSPEERAWFLAQIGKSVTASGAVVGGNTGGTGSWSAWGEGPGGTMLGFGALGHPVAGAPYAGQSQFSPEVEQWRQLVGQYFRPEDVNKALYIISKESGGRLITQHGGGPGTGLFQIEHGGYWPGRPSQQELLDPATNIAYAASMVYG